MPIFCLLSSNNGSILTHFQQQDIFVDKRAPANQIQEKYRKKTLKMDFFGFFHEFLRKSPKCSCCRKQIAILNVIFVKYTFIMHRRTHFPGYLRCRYHRGEEHMPYRNTLLIGASVPTPLCTSVRCPLPGNPIAH